jgi:plastocyanin
MALVRVTALVVAAAWIAGCGGAEPVERVRDGRVAIALDDFFLAPQNVRARAGEIAFEVTNRGRLAHNFRLRRGRGEPLQIKTMLPGDARAASVRLRRGDYRMVCTIANHAELGMTGILLVR